MYTLLIEQLTKETVDFAIYLDYEADFDEELVLLSIQYNQELLDAINYLPHYVYKEIIEIVLENAYNIFYQE